MIKSRIFIAFTLAEIVLLAVLCFSSYPLRQAKLYISLEDKKSLVQHLALTDFAIWTEARYTRHPSQTDFFSPFQEFPSALEHFPAGSVIAPPIGIRRPER
ncbi:MAG: hypothetical protein SCH71_13705 [Desulfobulbaceae bacterium]|nr:hypothetical protein [Desulfobulbaceae bacterium]